MRTNEKSSLSLERISDDAFGGETYLIDFGVSGGIKGTTNTSDLSGKLRLVRSSNEVTGYYFRSGAWIALSTSLVTTEDMSFGLAAWSHDYAFSHQTIKVTFDNFIVTHGLLVCPKSEQPPQTQPSSFSFKMSLPQGLNIVSLPVKPTTPFTARSFALKLNTSFVIGLIPGTSKFVTFSPKVHTGNGFIIEGGKGYIVNLTSAVDTVFIGSGWSNAAPLENPNSTWAFVVSGSIQDSAQLGYRQLKVRIRNRSTGQSAVEPIGLLEEGKFAVALVDLSKRSVASEGDLFEIFIESSNGDIIAGPISQKIGKREIVEAQLIVNIRTDEIVPKYTKLLQNYPNPFNPETWIPF